jgi:hypothetical protein
MYPSVMREYVIKFLVNFVVRFWFVEDLVCKYVTEFYGSPLVLLMTWSERYY